MYFFAEIEIQLIIAWDYSYSGRGDPAVTTPAECAEALFISDGNVHHSDSDSCG
jgi:hypothetical protein